MNTNRILDGIKLLTLLKVYTQAIHNPLPVDQIKTGSIYKMCFSKFSGDIFQLEFADIDKSKLNEELDEWCKIDHDYRTCVKKVDENRIEYARFRQGDGRIVTETAKIDEYNTVWWLKYLL